MAFSSKGQYDQAITDFTAAIKIDPKDILAYNQRGNALERQGQFDQALADFAKALEINPRDTATYVNRGIASRKKGVSMRLWPILPRP